jgi:hypothetical protein
LVNLIRNIYHKKIIKYFFTGHYGVIEEKTDSNFRFNSIKNFIWIYHKFGLIWVSEFIFACEAIVVTGAVSKWYFTRLVLINYYRILFEFL